MRLKAVSVARTDWIAGSLLFVATAAVVVWQGLSVAALWDLSFTLENAYRISLAQIPYRDFPFVYPPLTFVIQAALIKVTGAVYWHHVGYCAVVGGLATLLTWRILLTLLRESVERPRPPAFLLSTPLVVLGIYCIYPAPVYDADCTLSILASILLLLYVEENEFPLRLSFLAGMTLVVPLFIKQNTGLAFLCSGAFAILALLVIDRRRAGVARGYVTILSGMATGLVLAAMFIHLTAGLGNYLHWTLQYAAAGRIPFSNARTALWWLMSLYRYSVLRWWIPAFILGGLLLTVRRTNRLVIVLAAVMLSVPFIWISASLLTGDTSASTKSLLSLWPFVLTVSFVISVLAAPRRRGLALMLPFIVILTVHGAFLSQGEIGSTDSLWPLVIVLIASTLAALGNWTTDGSTTGMIIAFAAALSLLISGAYYTSTHLRFYYVKLDGRPERSAMPTLRGLTVHGPWLPQFDELAAYAKREIPAEDGLMIIPGEDPFYYATGREPRFPVLFFDYTVNPDSPEVIAPMARSHNIRWIVVKRALQLRPEFEEYPVENIQRLLQLLPECKSVKELHNYDILRCEPSHG
jgi:hypothetical protein